MAAIFEKLKNIRKLSNSSLTSIVDVTNLNFNDLSSATLSFLNKINYDEIENSFLVNKGSFTYVDIADTLSFKLNGIPTFTIDSLGKAEGREILVVVSEAKRRRFTNFNDWPDIGVPGEIIYTGVQNQKPEFGEDFIGYLNGRGWVSLTAFNNPIPGLNLLVEAGSPIVLPTPANGTGLIWIGPPGLQTDFEIPVNTTIYFTDDEYHTFDILSNFVWERIGNNATFIPTGKAIIDGAGFQFIDGNEAAGNVLTCDGLGNAYWAPSTGGGGGGTSNFAYWEIRSFTKDVTETITHGLTSNNVVVDFIDMSTNEKVDGHVDNYTFDTIDVTLAESHSSIKIVVLSAGGADSDTIQKLNASDKFMSALTTASDGDLATNDTITSTPVIGSYVEVKVNGIEYEVGDGVKTKACYFSGDGGVTAREFTLTSPGNPIQAGDKLYWNGSIAGFELSTGWRISLLYLV